MPRARVRKVERKRKRFEVKTEPLADGAGGSSAAGAGRAGARGGGGSDSGSAASHCGPPPAKRARVTVKKELKVKVKREKGREKAKGKGKVEGNGEEREDGEEELAFDLAPPRRRGGEAEEPLGPPRYGPRGQRGWDGVSRWMCFSTCRAFARSLGLKGQKEWEAWSKVPGQRPEDVPSRPNHVYAGYGWQGWGDFLGTGKGIFKSFDEARAFARGLKLSSVRAWEVWSKDHRPSDIPSAPDQFYKEAGWTNWGDFLGTGRSKPIFRSFDDARAFARGLKLSSVRAWNAWSKDHRPSDIPSGPDQVYKEAGWTNWGDFLGTVRNKRIFKSFDDARAFARGLKLSGQKAWQVWRKDHRPSDIPSRPDNFYKEAGWTNWGDFLGTGNKRKGRKPSNMSRRKKK